MTISFDQFVFDEESGELRNTDGMTRLQPEASTALRLLLANAGEFVSGETFAAALWPEGTEDRDDRIEACIRQLRVALGDSAAAPRFIDADPKRGYRFIAPVNVDDATPALRVDDDAAFAESSMRSRYLVTGVLALMYIGFRLYAHFSAP